jgi:hypothetical protein
VVFCDDGLGTHLGIICYAPGCGEGEAPWSLEDRFWQESSWSDVTAFAWDPNGQCLYVSTAEAYGPGDLYAVSLTRRKQRAVPLQLEGKVVKNGRHVTTITGLQVAKHRLIYELEYFGQRERKTVTEVHTLTIPACPVE